MQIKGSARICVVDSRTGEIKQEIEQNNLITNVALYDILAWYVRAIFNSIEYRYAYFETHIFISESTATPLPDTYPSVLAEAYTPQGIQRVIFNDTATPPYGQLQGRIDYTGTERVFTTVGLRSTVGRIYAYLLLDTPCIQGAYDYLDIFYRVQFLNSDGFGFSRQAILEFARACFGVGSFNMSRYFTSFANAPSLDCPYQLFYGGLDLGTGVSLYYAGYDENPYGGGTRVKSHFKYRMSLSYGVNDAIGIVFNSMLQGEVGGGRGLLTCKNIQNPSSPFQNLFTHSIDATVPFFDSLHLASGNGKIYLSGNWTGKFPELYRILVTKTGAVGEATYRWAVRKHLGFNGNSYSDRTLGCTYRNVVLNGGFDGCHGWRDENNDVLRHSKTQIVQYDDTGVTLLDVFDGSYKNWDSGTTPPLPVTQVRQCATDGSKIYVGCRKTGLWVIDVASNAIAQPLTNPCYGVDVGRNNVAFAMVEGGLYRSSDWSTPLPFTYFGITDSNWSKTYFLKVDPEHIEDRLAIVMQPATTANRRIVWCRFNAPIIPAGVFQFDSFADDQGVAYWIGTNYGAENWTNPHDAGRVTVVMSSIDAGGPSNMVNRQGGQNNHTQNIANSWMSIDLGAGNTLIPSYYILQNRGQYTGNILRNWKLQGCNNASSNSVTDLNNATWVDLDTRINDTTRTDSPDAWGGYAVSGVSQGYRWLRIFQFLLDSAGANYLVLGEFEFYGTFGSTISSRVPPARGLKQTVSGAENSNLKPWAASLDVSDTGSFWVAGSNRLAFGTPTTVGLQYQGYPYYFSARSVQQQLNHSIYGNDNYYKVSFYKNYFIAFNQLIDINNSSINYYGEFDKYNRSFILHLDSGIVLTNREMRQLFTDNLYCWDNYGWDGSRWVLNGNLSKSTHTDDQLLANGITIRFQNGSNTPHFVASDFYTQGVNYGLLKDNATSFYDESAWYVKPVKFDYPVQTNLIVPTSPTNAPPAPTRYWRIKNLSPGTGTRSYWGIRELIFRDAAGNDITNNGVAFVGGLQQYEANYLFDKRGDTACGITNSGNYGLQYTFPNPVVVYSITIAVYIPNSDWGMPADYSLEYSIDGFNWFSAYEFRRNFSSDGTSYDIPHQYNTAYEIYLDAKNDPGFITIEVDSPELTKLILNGQPLATTYLESAIPPGSNEAVVFSNGRLKFNSVDAGKTLSGTYAWVKN